MIPLTRWLSLDILLKSFSLIQTTLLSRALDFKTQIKANLFATLCAGVVGVAAATYGLGVWSLVIQTLAATLLRTAALWRLSDWRPALRFSLASLRGMFGFGSRMLVSGLLAVFFDNFYQIFIGKVFLAAPLRLLYPRRVACGSVVIDATSNTVGRVMYPALASIQDDTARLRPRLSPVGDAVYLHPFPLDDRLGRVRAAAHHAALFRPAGRTACCSFN